MKKRIQNSINAYIEDKINPKTYCIYCHRVLKTEESKKLGCGKRCYELHKNDKLNKIRSLISNGK